VIIQSADDIATLARRLLETEQQLRTVIASAGSGQPPAVMASSHAERTDPAALACALLDAEGVIVHASSAWRQQHALGGLFGTARETRVGTNFLQVCDRASRGPSTAAHRLAAGMRSVLDGTVTRFSLDLPGVATSTARIDVFGLGSELRERIVVTLVDDSDEPLAQAASVGNETRFRSTFEQAAVGIAHLSPAGDFVEVNDRFCVLTSYTRDELLHLGMPDLTLAKDLDVGAEARVAMLAGEASSYSADTRFHCRDGSEQWLHLNTTLVRDAHGAPAYFIVVSEAITERKHAEFRLKRLNRLYSVLRRVGEAIVATTDRRLLYAEVCRIAVELGGLPMAVISELEAETGRILPVATFGVDVSYAEGLEGNLHNESGDGTAGTALRTGRYDVCNDIYQDPRMGAWVERSRKWGFRAFAAFPLIVQGRAIGALVLLAGEVDYFQSDEIDLMVAIADEVSFALESIETAAQTETAQAAMRSSEASLIEAQRIALLGNWEWDVQRNELRWSQEIYRNLGLPLGTFADVLPTQAFFDAVHPADLAGVKQALQRSFNSGAPYDIEYRIVHPSGEERVVHTLGQTFFNESGRISRLAGTAQDITEQKFLELEKEHERQVLELVAQGASLPEVLNQLVLRYEVLFPGMRGSVLLLDSSGQHLHHGAAPHLPTAFSQAIDGVLIGPDRGSCGTAAHTGHPAIVADIANDPLWRDFKSLALEHGLLACWSVPILGVGDRVLGTLAFYFGARRPALPAEIASIQRGAQLASLAIERQRTESALRESENKFRTLFENASDAIFLFLDGRFIDCNARSLEMFGCQSRDQIVGHSLFDFSPPLQPDGRGSRELATEKIIDTLHGIPQFFEWMHIKLDGTPFPVEVSLNTLELGGHMVVQGIVRDITERRAADERLRQNQMLLHIAGQTALIGGWTFDIAAQRLTLSDEICAMRELPPGTTLPIETALTLYAPEHCAAIADAFEGCRQNAEPYDLEAEILTATGKRAWVRTMGQAVRDASGAIVRVQGAMQDISGQKRTEVLMSRLVNRLTTTLESITDAFFTLDSQWRFTYVNAESERLLQRKRAELLGANVWELFPEAIGTLSDTEYRRAVAERCTVAFEHHHEPLGLWAEVRAYPSEEGLTVFFRDITERKQAEQQAYREEQTRAALLRVQQEIVAVDLSLQAAMSLIAEKTRVLVGATGSAIDLVEDDEFVRHAAAGVCIDSIGLHRPRDHSLSGLAVNTGEVLLCADTETDPRVDAAAMRLLGARSLMVAPLRDGDRFIGVFKLISDRARAFVQRDVSTLQILAESLGAVIQRHRAANELRASEAQYRLLFNSNPHPMWVYDIATLRFLAVNEAAQHHYGYSVAEFLAMNIRQIRAPDAVAALDKALSGVRDGTRHLGIWQHRRKDGSVIDVEITSDSITFDGHASRLVLAHDITERLRAERELVRVSRAQRLLSRYIEAQMRADDESALLTEICQIAVDIGGYRMAWVGYAQHDPARTILPVACAGDNAGYLSEIVLTWSDHDAAGLGPAGQTIRTGQPALATDLTLASAHVHWHKRAVECGYLGVICLPLRNAAHTFGLLGLYTPDIEPIGDEEIELLQELADDLAFGIGNLRAQHERKLLQSAVMKVAAGVSATTGTAFFEQLARSMTEALGADAGYVVRLDADDPRLARSIMALNRGEVGANFEYRVDGTPCANLLDDGECVVSAQVSDRFPNDPLLRTMEIQAYVGRRLDNSQGKPIGLLYVLYRSPLEQAEFAASTLQIFAARAGAELERLDSDARIREQASLLDQAQDAIIVHEVSQHRILYWNQGAQRLFGWTSEQAVGRPMGELLQIDPDEAQGPLQCVLEQGEWRGEFSERRMDGSAILVEVRCTLARDANNAPRSILSIMSDITERRQAEESLQQAMVDLNNRNRELQDFAFVASHDLQEPLRKIRAFSDRLISRPSTGLDEQARDYLQRSAQAAERMQTLIDDLLEFSRIDSRGRSFAPVDLGPLLATVIDDLNERIESTSARIEVGPMPTLDGDHTQLRQLFQNLLANALKFCDPQRAPRIRVHAEPARTDQGRAAFRINVEDNGIGFDVKYAERIFAPFQRLHSREKYEGTGIGLAIVRRIVERHRGRIDVRAVLNQGASFSVLLPQRQRHVDRDREVP